jgi:hypothetical protein
MRPALELKTKYQLQYYPFDESGLALPLIRQWLALITPLIL